MLEYKTVVKYISQSGFIIIWIKRKRYAFELRKKNYIKIAKKLSIIGLWCIQWYSIDRPSLKNVIGMLKGEEDNLIIPPNPFASTKHTISSVGRRKASIQPKLMIILEKE